MKRLRVALLLFVAMYLALLILFSASVSDGSGGPIWAIWVLSAMIALSGTATDLTLLAIWVWLKIRGSLFKDPYVPMTLTDRDFDELQRKSPTVAVLVPAHKEATTCEDRHALEERLLGVLSQTPAWVMVFVLFDSPQEQRNNEVRLLENVKRQLRTMGRHADVGRLFCEEYRSKPNEFRNKQGSIVLWLSRHRERFRYMFVVDADSSLPRGDSLEPEERDVLSRLVLTMERHPELAMIQSAINIPEFSTTWGWSQFSNAQLAGRYHRPVLQWVFEGQQPSFGHNVLFRTSAFAHVVNTTEYLSHDFLDASDLASAGWKCISTCRCVTFEQPEESLLGYVAREFRWARGNAQWISYWVSKPRLALGPKAFLGIGILDYVWPLAVSTMLASSVFLLHQGSTFVTGPPWVAALLFSLVVLALVLPKFVSARSLAELNLSLLLGVVITPALMLLRGVAFLVGPFGTKWTPRGSRNGKPDSRHAAAILRVFYPVALLGMILDFFLGEVSTIGFGELLVRLHVSLLILSPFVVLALSFPLPNGHRVPGRAGNHLKPSGRLEG